MLLMILNVETLIKPARSERAYLTAHSSDHLNISGRYVNYNTLLIVKRCIISTSKDLPGTPAETQVLDFHLDIASIKHPQFKSEKYVFLRYCHNYEVNILFKYLRELMDKI